MKTNSKFATVLMALTLTVGLTGCFAWLNGGADGVAWLLLLDEKNPNRESLMNKLPQLGESQKANKYGLNADEIKSYNYDLVRVQTMVSTIDSYVQKIRAQNGQLSEAQKQKGAQELGFATVKEAEAFIRTKHVSRDAAGVIAEKFGIESAKSVEAALSGIYGVKFGK